MTGVAPPTIPSVDTGTPPKKWSESILASDSPSDMPGAFRDPQARQSTPDIAEQTREEIQPSKTTPSRPSPGKRKEEPHDSLPSTELKGAQPLEHTGGVGALPGNLSESSVALLPEERQERKEATSRQRRDTVKPLAGDGEEEPRRSEKEVDETKIPRETISTGKEVPGTSQRSDVYPESEGPKIAEKNLASHSGPEVSSREGLDQIKSQKTTSECASAAAVATTGGMVGTAPGSEGLDEKTKDVEGSNLGSATLGQQENPSDGVQDSEEKHRGERTAGSPSGKPEGGQGGEYHPAQLHPPPPGASVAEYQSSHGQQPEGAQEAPTTTKEGKRASVGGEKKPGFMTMVKGEMKIIAGKMSGDDHKVEEGKRIVHGEA